MSCIFQDRLGGVACENPDLFFMSRINSYCTFKKVYRILKLQLETVHNTM